MEKNIFYHNENNKYMQYHSYEKYSTFRWSEFVALVSLSTTFFLFLHSRDLTIQLSQEKLRHQDEDDTSQQGLVFGIWWFKYETVTFYSNPVLFSHCTAS